MVRKKSGTRKQKKFSPRVEWQTGEFDRRLSLSTVLPYEFLLLCKLINVTPSRAILDFLEELSFSNNSKKSAREDDAVLKYFISRYNNEFSDQEVTKLISELSIPSKIELSGADNELLDLFERWKDRYYHHWFNKWLTARHCQK